MNIITDFIITLNVNRFRFKQVNIINFWFDVSIQFFSFIELYENSLWLSNENNLIFIISQRKCLAAHQ